MAIFNKKNGSVMFIFISLKFQYSHESVLHIWTSLFKHLAGGGGTENRWYIHIMYIQFQHLSQGGK